MLLFTQAVWGQAYNISGTVRDGETGGLVPGAEVHVHETKDMSVTDTDGKFHLADIRKGTYHIHVTMLGYEPAELTLKLNKDTAGVVFTISPTYIEINQVDIESDQVSGGMKEQAMNISIADKDMLVKNYAGTLSATLEKLPGLSVINVGVGISKPVIRGFSGTRVIVADHGIKQEGQQWGTDHGLELDQYDVERMEIIKGAASLLYGSEGIGGILNILPPHIPKEGDLTGEVLTFYRSNNHNVGGSVAMQGNFKKNFFRFRFTTQDFGDYQVPADQFTYNRFVLPISNNRLKNTAGFERNASISIGTMRKWGNVRLLLSNYYQKVGLFVGAVGIPRAYQLEDDGNARDIDLPYQLNDHFKAIVNAKFLIKDSWLHVNFGFQNNHRQEHSLPHSHGQGPTPSGDEALRLNLMTYSLNGTYNRYLNTKWKLVAGLDMQMKDNKRGGFEFLLPDYRSYTGGVFVYSEYQLTEQLVLSGGLRFDYARMVVQAFTANVYEDEQIVGQTERTPYINRSFYNPSGALGLSWSPLKWVNVKLNLARSFRVPVAAELSANGVHHGTFRHELGDPDLNSETGWQADLGLYIQQKKFHIELTPFFDYFDNYIYLRPTAEFSPLPDAGQLYKYVQHSVIYMGVEFLAEYHPVEGLHIDLAAEYIHNYNIETGLGLPFTPPLSIGPGVEYNFEKLGKAVRDLYFGMEYKYYAAQNNVDRNELTTPSYQLLHFNSGVSFVAGKQRFELSFRIQNLLNEKYLNHMSRYRILNLPEPGRNFLVTLRVPLTFKSK